MARVRAVLALEELNADAGGARSMSDAGSRFTVQIVNRIAAPEPPAITISARTIPAPFPSPLVEPEPEPPPPDPIFSPRSLSDLTIHPLISFGFASFPRNTKRNNISMLRVAKTSSPTGC